MDTVATHTSRSVKRSNRRPKQRSYFFQKCSEAVDNVDSVGRNGAECPNPVFNVGSAIGPSSIFTFDENSHPDAGLVVSGSTLPQMTGFFDPGSNPSGSFSNVDVPPNDSRQDSNPDPCGLAPGADDQNHCVRSSEGAGISNVCTTDVVVEKCFVDHSAITTAIERSPPSLCDVPPTGFGGPSGEPPIKPVVHSNSIPQVSCLVVNIRSFLTHRVEMEARIQSLAVRPVVIGITESWLDDSIEHVSLVGYVLVVRRDRGDGRKGGGILLFVREDVGCVSHLFDSKVAERTWAILHSDFGPIVISLWYRPPDRGNIDFVSGLNAEFLRFAKLGVGVVLLGDFNVHQESWLKFSSGNSPEGWQLQKFCIEQGLTEHVKAPTRGDNLLDLVLSDLGNSLKIEVLPEINQGDHSLVLVHFDFGVPVTVSITRNVWFFKKADWKRLQNSFAQTQWLDILDSSDSSVSAEKFTAYVLDTAKKFIPYGPLAVKKSEHPWMNDKVKVAVEAKLKSYGSDRYVEQCSSCSAVIMQEYKLYQSKMRDELLKLPRSDKRWWALAKALLHKKEKCISIPPLKSGSEWCHDPTAKANALSSCWQAKSVLPPEVTPVQNGNAQASNAEEGPPRRLSDFMVLRQRVAKAVLKNLNVDSGTGPDLVPSRILKYCANELCLPLILLCRIVVNTGVWPAMWRTHWVCPVFKRGATSDPGNYRGVHLTSHIAKAVERVICHVVLPFFEATGAYGEHQFAHRKQHSSRDVLFLLTNSWLLLLADGKKNRIVVI